MTVYVYRDGKIVPRTHEAKPWSVMVISDTMEPAKHMGTGRVLDSKSRFRADTKASGCVEIGNEPIRPRSKIMLDRSQRRDDIRRAVYNLRNGIKSGSE